MSKSNIGILFFSLLLFGIASGDVVRTTTGVIWTNITFDNRTLVDWDYFVFNDSYGMKISPYISNLERKNMFLVFKIIPTPDEECFRNYQNCQMSGFDTLINISYARPSAMASFWTGEIKYSSNWGASMVDVSTCWNWWNTTDAELRKSQVLNCPTIAIRLDDKAEGCSMLMQTSSPYGATPNYIARLQGFATNYVDIDTKVSKPILRFVQSLSIFEDTIVRLWQIFYLVMAVAIIFFCIMMVFGILPLGLKWIVKKVSEE